MSLPRVIRAIRNKKNKRFVIAAHVNPEADALGSALALAALLRQVGKQARVINDGGTPKALEFLPGSSRVGKRLPRGFVPDVAVTVDVPVYYRIGSVKPIFEQVPLLISIDHHASHQGFAQINWVDPSAPATGAMIYQLYQAMKVPFPKDAAYCMQAAIVTDTGSFKYRNTTASVLRMAADLIQRGKVSPLEISQNLYESHRLKDLKILGDILRRLKSGAGGRVAWVEVPRALMRRAGPEIIDELVNYPRAIKKVEVAMAMRESLDQHAVRVSLRSKGRVNVDMVARAFGGGGHRAASGCTVKGNLAQVRQQLLREIKKRL